MGKRSIIILVAVSGLAWLFFSSEGRKIVSEISKTIYVETNIENYDCQAVADLVKGLELQNGYGAKYEIVALKDLSQDSKTDKKIVCHGQIVTTGGDYPAILSVENVGDNEILYRVEPVYTLLQLYGL